MPENNVQHLTCIMCPVGCSLTVTCWDEVVVSGNRCPLGKRYGQAEVTNPVRMVTSSVKVNHGCQAVVSVKTRESIPKALLKEAARALVDVAVEAPVHIGDVVMSNFLDTGVDIIATAEVEKQA